MLLSGIVGSTAYGLAGPGSDVDRLGMFALPTLELVGIGKPRMSIVEKNPDVAWHEAGKAVSLALAGNPTTIELFWLPEELYETRTPLGEEVIALRSKFLCAHRAKDAYMGYATQQFRKLLNRNEAEGPAPARTAKHARHLMRLVEQGYELYTTGTVRIRLEDPQRLRDFGAAVAEDPQRAVPFMAEAEERFDRARTVLPDQPDYDAAQDWLLRVRRAYWE